MFTEGQMKDREIEKERDGERERKKEREGSSGWAERKKKNCGRVKEQCIAKACVSFSLEYICTFFFLLVLDSFFY